MPIYEYRCEACGHQMEKLQRITDAPPRDCPACKAPQLRRLVSAAGFRLKGGGWYETDFKQGDKRNLHDTGKDKSAESKPDAGAESKPDAGADSKKPEAKTASGGPSDGAATAD